MSKLDLIRKKIETIRHGILRFRDGTVRRTMEVKASAINGTRLNCVVNDPAGKLSLLHREVNLVQKQDDDYLYISAKVDDESKVDKKVISLKIIKAFWFTRQKKGSSEWLEEKFTYDGEDFEKAS